MTMTMVVTCSDHGASGRGHHDRGNESPLLNDRGLTWSDSDKEDRSVKKKSLLSEEMTGLVKGGL